MPFDIVDLFAGPGGLGEGFSSLADGTSFQILVSAEMEASAHSTLRLRSFFRKIRRDEKALATYYAYCNGEADAPYNDYSEKHWIASGLEARRLTLGDDSDNATLDEILDTHLPREKPWVLIGGPPCQAYSIVGRARNGGTPTYRAENDQRHFLYKEYLRIIRDRRPTVFVMENVLGILSARVSGRNIFHDILRDLANPSQALGIEDACPGYRIHSLVSDDFYESGMDLERFDPRTFIVRAEEYGIPQARHRVILIGVRRDVPFHVESLIPLPPVSVADVILDLPPLRSRLTKVLDSTANWEHTIKIHLKELSKDATRKKLKNLSGALRDSARGINRGLGFGSLRVRRDLSDLSTPHHSKWYLDPNLKVWLNHESRSHMTSDLRRYTYAATFAKLEGYSPTGHAGFSLLGLAPDHQNWESGKFSDRFRVQRFNAPATTITSHISKDGHYFIHPDPTQCRSLTVREAARIQTFPDNYFFQGTKTQQYHQVGNAVPPILAMLVARRVYAILKAYSAMTHVN